MQQDIFELGSPYPGPRLVCTILMHGDETCGLAALEAAQAGDFALNCGSVRIIVMNRAAHDAARGPLRHLGTDMNRIWSAKPLKGGSGEARRIETVLPYLQEADAILDIHSMPDQNTPFLFISQTRQQSASLAMKLGAVVPRVVVAPPPKNRGVALFETELLPIEKPIVVVECGQHQAVQAPDIARAIFHRFLSVHGMVDSSDVRAEGGDDPVSFYEMSREIELKEGPLKLARTMHGFDALNAGETYGWDGHRPLVAEEDCCVLLTRPAIHRGDEALTLVRPITGNTR
ncbi:M14 family metallopeptidase [Martelella soudanensis]|uniref:succinylglutamate desuccinylase/aspartoacylase domain-containing protein n=1 Tax=unclassified Martelella TaxID=2629616 RepID=UPI0015DF00DF|nr:MULTISPECIES: succinylglutamate desuccinylase/aspartoacylase family protein [unclassified Martelella]